MKTKALGVALAVAVLVSVGLWAVFSAGDQPGRPAPLDRDNDAGHPSVAAPLEPDAAVTETSAAASDATGPILILVRSTENDEPVPAVTISLSTPEGGVAVLGETDEDGSLRIGPTGDHTAVVTARCEGFLTNTMVLPSDAGEHLLHLEPGVPVRGRVIEAESGEPIPGAIVRVRDEESLDDLDEPIRTDTEGRFAVAGVRKGLPFSFEVVKDGFGPAWITGRRESAGSEIVVRLGGGARIAGKVTAADGTPAAGAEVLLLLEGDDPRQAVLHSKSCELPSASNLPRSICDEDGWYEFRGLPVPCTWLLVARAGARGWSAPTRVFLTAADAKERRDFTLKPCPTIRVRVTDEVGIPVPTAWVRSSSRGNRPGLGIELGRGEAREPEADGAYLLLPDGEGPFEIRVEAPGFVPAEREVEVAAGDAAEVVVLLARGVCLEGSIFDSGRRPVAGAGVWFSISSEPGVTQQSAYATSAADGSFRLEGLQEARGQLTVSPRGSPQQRLKDVLPGGDPVTVRVSPPTLIIGRFSPNPNCRAMSFAYRGADGGGTSGDGPLGSDGTFTLHPSSWFIRHERGPKSFTLSVCPDGWPPVMIPDLKLNPGEILDLGEVPLDPGVAITGLVEDSLGSPVAGARVGFYTQTMLNEAVRYTDQEGRFLFPTVSPGIASITVEPPGFLLGAFRKIPETTTEGPLHITLAPAGEVVVNAVGPEEMPVSGLRIELAPLDLEEPVQYGNWETDSGGRMRFTAPAGRFRIRYVGPDGMEDGPDVSVTVGQRSTVRLAVPFKGPTGDVLTQFPR